MTIVITGYQVVELGEGHARPLSRIFTIKAAAERFAELARRNGCSTAAVNPIFGTEKPQGTNYEFDFAA